MNEQTLYEILKNLVRLAIILATILATRKRIPRKRVRKKPHNDVRTGEIQRKDVEA